MSSLHPTIERVTERIVERSRASRARYLDLMAIEGERHADRNAALPCSNLAHGFAAARRGQGGDPRRRAGRTSAIVSAYNDTHLGPSALWRLSAADEDLGRAKSARPRQVAGATPAMCDGVTQGLDGHGAVACSAAT